MAASGGGSGAGGALGARGTGGPGPAPGLRETTRRIIFETDTPAGKVFDVALLLLIGVSVVSVMLESVAPIARDWGRGLRLLEWLVTLLFTAEYALRLWCVARPGAYARSFFGIVDLLAILPTYLSVILPGSQSLLVIRALRLLRIFRVFKAARYLVGANVLMQAIRASAPKVVVFLGTMVILVTIMGATMYLVEGAENGFTSVPRSIYWAIVTMTTVGYGDLAPQTVLGQILASAAMIMGYSIIAVPTGIVSAELVQSRRGAPTTRVCPRCLSEGHEAGARFCKDCGAALAARQPGEGAATGSGRSPRG